MRTSRVVQILAALLVAACSAGSSAVRGGGPMEVAASASDPLADATVMALYVAHDADYNPVATMLFLGHPQTDDEQPAPIEGVPDDPWDGCDPSVGPLPAGVDEFMDVSSPGQTAWVPTSRGACRVQVGEAQLVLGQGGYDCDESVAFRLGDELAACTDGLDPNDVAPVAIVADALPDDVRWVPAVEVDVQVDVTGAGPASLSADGVTTVVDPASQSWDQESLADWSERLERGEVGISHRALVLAARGTDESAEEREMSWLFYDGDDPTLVDCSCDDWETGARKPGCIDDYYEVLHSEVGLARAGTWTPSPADFDAGHLRGAVVVGGRIALVVTGYLTDLAVERRRGDAIEGGTWIAPIPLYEESNEESPAAQAPYCGP